MSTTAPARSTYSAELPTAPGVVDVAGAAPSLADLLPLRGPVLLATDGGGQTNASIVVAHRIAEHLGVPLVVVAVLAPVPVSAYAATLAPLPPEYEAPWRRDDVEAAVTARLTAALPHGARWQVHVRFDAPAAGIAEVAAAIGASLVVLGPRADGVLAHVFGDDVAVRLARNAPCPVLAVAAEIPSPLTRAAVGMDFSPASIYAARVALALLGGDNGPAVLTLVHTRPALTQDVPIARAWEHEYEAGTAALFTRVVDVLRSVTSPGVGIETATRTGPPAATLTEAAEAADLVAVGTRGARWAERLLLGSVSTSTLRRARGAVLVAPVPRPAVAVRLELAMQGQAGGDTTEAFAATLATFAVRNAGRRVQLAVYDAGTAAFRLQAEGYVLAGAAYDPHDGTATLMLHDPRALKTHLTHAMPHVRGVRLSTAGPPHVSSHDRTLVVEHEGGEAVVTFLDAREGRA